MLFRVVFIHPGCFLDFSGSWCTSSRLFALHPGSFWTCMYLIRVVFWSIRVLLEFVLVLVAPLRGCFMIDPGSFWICLGTCRTLSGFFFDQSGFFLSLSWFLPYLIGVLFLSNQVVSRLALMSMFFLISWYRCSSPYPGCFLINPGSFWICLGTCSTSLGLFSDRSGFFLNLSW